MKILSAINYTASGLKRAHISRYTDITVIVYNYRRLIVSLGYNCSLLDDSEILGLAEAIHAYETGSDIEWLSDTLENLTTK